MQHRFLFLISFAVALLLGVAQSAAAQQQGDFTVGKNTLLLNGKPFVVKAAELHYPRIPQPYWEHRIKMCKALGMNTICLYVFWNIHEQKEGQFDFTGQNDVAAFCRLAQKNGMYVIVRPGPYVCAEWEMGGLPWWLLRKKDIRLREQDPYFMERVRIFEHEVGRQLAPLTIQNGGPIIMVQVENEYGSYGEDKPYVAAIRDIVRESGFDKVLLFQCDWSSNFTKNGLDDLTWTMNFGTGAQIDQQFKRLGELRPDAPKMCSEFWSGWFDKWGARHETRPAEDMVRGMEEMLQKGISFSLYMTHGGTSFGHWAGANSPGFAPDVTSYDYDAPINEYGQPTEKFFLLRDMMQKYNDGVRLPAVPKAPMSIVKVPPFELKEFRPIKMGWAETHLTEHDIITMEVTGMGWGSMQYSTSLPDIPKASVLTIHEAHDFAQVFVNAKRIGSIDRVKNERSILLPPVSKGDRLTILVEAMGRINFGRAIKDFKGITERVEIRTEKDGHDLVYDLKNWDIDCIPDDVGTAQEAFNPSSDFAAGDYDDTNGIGYYRGTFQLKKVGDTFLNMEKWGKGQLYVNGHAIGRFWSIGPQQTLYVPGCWLKKGKNEVIVLDVVGPRETVIWGQDKPELDKLQVEKANKHDKSENRPDLQKANLVFDGDLDSGNGWQTLRFLKPARGRYVALQVLSTQKENDRCAIAELYLKDASRNRLPREAWTAFYADSEELGGNHTLDKVFDLQESTFWQTEKGKNCPHVIVIDLGTEQVVSFLDYLPRAEQNAPGSVKKLQVYVY